MLRPPDFTHSHRVSAVKMPIDWKDKAVQDRLLMAVIASVDNNINIREIARLYGGEMTYNAAENYLRKFRKESQTMKASAEGRDAPVPSPARPRTNKKTGDGTPNKGGVRTGRVTKKKAPASKIKTEAIDEDILGRERSGSDETVSGRAVGGGSEDAGVDEEEV